VSYQSIAQLTSDVDFTGRTTAAATQQAEVYKDDARPEFVALADGVLKGSAGPLMAFTRMAAAAPGIGDKADAGDGTIDQSKVTDADLLSLTQANWPVVAGLYFTDDGTPR
jgi:hypothetical protein